MCLWHWQVPGTCKTYTTQQAIPCASLHPLCSPAANCEMQAALRSRQLVGTSQPNRQLQAATLQPCRPARQLAVTARWVGSPSITRGASQGSHGVTLLTVIHSAILGTPLSTPSGQGRKCHLANLAHYLCVTQNAWSAGWLAAAG